MSKFTCVLWRGFWKPTSIVWPLLVMLGVSCGVAAVFPVPPEAMPRWVLGGFIALTVLLVWAQEPLVRWWGRRR